MRTRWMVAAALAAAWALGGMTGAAAAGAPSDVVLREVRIWEHATVPETLVTCIAPGKLRLSHASGDAIVDVAAARLVILDRRTSTYHLMSFTEWEERIRASAPGADSLPAPRFEPIGDGGRIAGYACTRHHLFIRHEVFPGEFEQVEAEIWVTSEIPLDPAAVDTYRRVQASFDRVDFGAPVLRPPGLVLRSQLRHVPETPGTPAESEISNVVTIERRAVAPAEFDVPAGYRPAASTESAPADSGAGER